MYNNRYTLFYFFTNFINPIHHNYNFFYLAREIKLITSVLLSKHSFIYTNIAKQIILKVREKSTIYKFNKNQINNKVIQLYIQLI